MRPWHRPRPSSSRPAGEPDRVEDGEGQVDPQRLQDLRLLDGMLARGGQDAQCASGSAGKMDAAEARQKARAMKAEALGMRGS